jgi:hypothetical protein
MSRKAQYVRINTDQARELLKFVSKQYVSHEYYPKVKEVIALCEALDIAADSGLDLLNRTDTVGPGHRARKVLEHALGNPSGNNGDVVFHMDFVIHPGGVLGFGYVSGKRKSDSVSGSNEEIRGSEARAEEATSDSKSDVQDPASDSVGSKDKID